MNATTRTHIEAVVLAPQLPDWPALGSNQVSALPAGSSVIAVCVGDRDAQHYTVYRESGRIYARSPSDVAAGVLNRDKVLTFVTQVWLPAS